MEEIIQLINSIKWPVVVIIIFIINRRPIANIIPFIKTIKYLNFEATFEKDIKKFEKDTKNLPAIINVKVKDEIKGSDTVSVKKDFDDSNRSVQLAKIDPRSAIIDAWRNLELVILDKAQELNIPIKQNTMKIVKSLWNKGILELADKKLIENSSHLRNKAVHVKGFELSFIDSVTYSNAVGKLSEYIKNKKV